MMEDDPKRGDPATIVGLFHKHPGTIILVEERRMLVQEDIVVNGPTDMICEYVDHNRVPGSARFRYLMRNPQGVIRGFVRRKNSKKWHDAHEGKLLSVIIGRRIYEQSSPGSAQGLL